MEEKNIISPCISVCKTDPVSGYCYGCGRTNADKVLWKDENTTDEWMVNNLKELKTGLSNWQLEAFEKSYQSKIETGLSLIKKKIFDTQNKKN